MHPDDDTPATPAALAGVGTDRLRAVGGPGHAQPGRAHGALGQARAGRRTAAATSTAPVAGVAEVPQTSSLAGQALVQASDCLRCHGMDRRYVSIFQIADRYREQPDAANYLARKSAKAVSAYGAVP